MMMIKHYSILMQIPSPSGRAKRLMEGMNYPTSVLFSSLETKYVLAREVNSIRMLHHLIESSITPCLIIKFLILKLCFPVLLQFWQNDYE